MSKTNSTAIRLSITSDISRALSRAKKLYPTLSDPEILKLGLAKIVTESYKTKRPVSEREAVRKNSTYSVGKAYLSDTTEDTYTSNMGKKVHFQ